MRIHHSAVTPSQMGPLGYQAAAKLSLVSDGSVRFRPAAAAKDTVQLGARDSRENVSADRNSTAVMNGVAAAATATIPPVGPVISAILAAVAAVINLIGQITPRANESEAAANGAGAGKDSLVYQSVDRPRRRRPD